MAAWDEGIPHWHLVPAHLRDGLRRYAEQGVRTGGFLEEVLSNNLVGAAMKADAESHLHLADIANFVVWWMPVGSWGSEDDVKAWRARRGLAGQNKEEDNELP